MLIAIFYVEISRMPYSLTEYLSMAYTMFMENSALFNIFNNEYQLEHVYIIFVPFILHIWNI